MSKASGPRRGGSPLPQPSLFSRAPGAAGTSLPNTGPLGWGACRVAGPLAPQVAEVALQPPQPSWFSAATLGSGTRLSPVCPSCCFEVTYYSKRPRCRASVQPALWRPRVLLVHSFIVILGWSLQEACAATAFCSILNRLIFTVFKLLFLFFI